MAKHPAREALHAFSLGKLDDVTAAQVRRHLDACTACRDAVAPSPHPVAAIATAPTDLSELPPELAKSTQYEVLRVLGRGGMGVVYLAKNRLMDRLEVLKVINPALLNRPGAAERFLREIRSAAKLTHANVVTAYSAVHQGRLLAFAMEYVEGSDLATLVRAQGPLPLPHACFYIQQAAWGLQHAHEKQMGHRDIKPQNLMLARDGPRHVVKILDFGLAKATREKSANLDLTRAGQMLGTPDYIAPEQALDAAHADIRADLYSLGCTLYFLLTGRAPFIGHGVAAILLAHQKQEPTPVQQLRVDVPAALAAVVHKLMAKEPSQRYQTPAELAQALAPFTRSAPRPMNGKQRALPDTNRSRPVRPAAAPTMSPLHDQPEVTWESVVGAEAAANESIVVTPALIKKRAATQRFRRRLLIVGGVLVGCLVLLAALGKAELPRRLLFGQRALIALPDPAPLPFLPNTEPRAKAAVPDNGPIAEAIANGVRYLKASQNPLGSWPGRDNKNPYPAGHAAVVGLALLECRVAPEETVLAGAAQCVRGLAPNLDKTHEIAAAVLFLDRLGDPQDHELIQQLAFRLLRAQQQSGGWSYAAAPITPAQGKQLQAQLETRWPWSPSNPRPARRLQLQGGQAALPLAAVDLRQLPDEDLVWNRAQASATAAVDNSNTQFASLASWAARRHGVAVECPLLLSYRHFRGTQNRDGGWAYRHGQDSKPSMTCVGMLGLALGHGVVQPPKRAARDNPDAEAMQHGLARLAAWLNPPPLEANAKPTLPDYYLLWCIESVAMVYGLETIGGKDWYVQGANDLLARQSLTGEWQNGQYAGACDALDTAFALLFLSRSKLAPDLECPRLLAF